MADPSQILNKIPALARRLGQSLKPGFAGVVPDIEKSLSASPQLAEALGAIGSRIPAIPPKLHGTMDVQDLLQESLAAILSTADPAARPAAAEQAMKAFINRMLGSPEMRATSVPVGAPGAMTAGFEDKLSQALGGAAAKRPGVTLPDAVRIKESLPAREKAAIEAIVAGTAQPQQTGMLHQIRKRIGTAEARPARTAAKGARARGEAKPEVPPAKQVTDPEEVARTLAAYEKVVPPPPEEALQLLAPRVKGLPGRRKTPKTIEEGGGFLRRVKEAPPLSPLERAKKRFGPAKPRED